MTRTFSGESGAGILPKRKHAFHIPPDVDDNDNGHKDDQPCSVPFPRGASTSPPPRTLSPRPQLVRGVSTPILLSNGKPLKSSLKTSSSSLAISVPPEVRRLHIRAQSEPAIPAKNVHFPEKDYALATVCVFSRSASPATLSSPTNVNDDETEADGEDTSPASFPYAPTVPVPQYEIDPTRSSPLLCNLCSPPHVILEPLRLFPSSSSSTAKLSLIGSILVSNLAFEKQVAIRFTLDDWQTVSEVGAHYADSPSLLPSHILSSSFTSTTHLPGARGWDRFTFTIRLDDYLHCLSTRTLWLASRYRIDSTYPEPGSTQYGPGGEWWDNNYGKNYRVAFRPVTIAPTFPQGRPRRDTISEPFFPTRAQPQLPVICREHAPAPGVPFVSKKATLNKTDERSIPPRAGKLCLINYAPPSMVAPSTPFPSTRSPQHLSAPSITNPDLLSTTASRPSSQSDEDTASPASSVIRTPSSSPTVAPQVIVHGHPATSFQPHRLHEEDVASLSKPGHIADWSLSFDKLRTAMEGLSCQPADPDPMPDLDAPERQHDDATLSGGKALTSSGVSNNLLPYDAFVTQWCFARGPEPSRGPWYNARPLLADAPFL